MSRWLRGRTPQVLLHTVSLADRATTGAMYTTDLPIPGWWGSPHHFECRMAFRAEAHAGGTRRTLWRKADGHGDSNKMAHCAPAPQPAKGMADSAQPQYIVVVGRGRDVRS